MDVIFLKVLNMSISASWLILAVIVLRPFLKKAPKWILCVLWAMVAIRLIFPLSFESTFSLIPSAETINPSVIQHAQEPALNSGVTFIDDTLNPIINESVSPTPDISANPLQIWISVGGVVWSAGLIVLLGYALFSYLRIRNKCQEAILLRDNIWLCDAVKSPFILGIIRPRIYLSSSIEERQITYVLAHEQAHLKRKDHWWKPLGYLLQAVYWFNPLIWIAYILFCRDIELACDEKVIKDLEMNGKKAYSHAMLSCSMQKKILMTCPLAFGEVGVKERVKTVLNYKKPAFWIIVVAIVACISVALCFLTNPKYQPESIEPPVENADTPENTDTSETTVPSEEEEPVTDEPIDSESESITSSRNFGFADEARAVLKNYGGSDALRLTFSHVIKTEYSYESLGYLLKDLDGNGVDELIFGANTDGWDNGGWDGIIYDIYTLDNGTPVHVLSGWERNRYYLCETGYIANESSGSAFDSSYSYYTYSGTELTLVESVMHRIPSNEERLWFYSTEETYDTENAEHISAEQANEIMSKYVHEHPQYISFEEL